MAEAIRLEYTVDLDEAVASRVIRNNLYTGEANAHTFSVAVNAHGEQASLNGMGVSASFVKSNKETVAVNGTVEDNKAVVTLPADCYTHSGPFSLFVILQASGGDFRQVILFVTGNIVRSATDNIVIPHVSYDDILALYEKIREEAAKVPSGIGQTLETIQSNLNQTNEKVSGIDTRVYRNEDHIALAASEIAKKVDADKVIRRSNNLFDITEALDKTGINATTGALTSNGSYWVTGKIPVSGPFVLSRQPYNIYFYRSDDTLQSKTSGTGIYGVQYPASDVAYVRIAFAKSSLAFEKADTLGVFLYDDPDGFAYTYESPLHVKPLSARDVLTGNKVYDAYSDGSGRNVIISMKCKGKGSIKFSYAYPHRTNSNSALYESMTYPIDVTGGHEVHEWRVPPFPDGCTRMKIDVTVASGDTLDVLWIRSRFDDTVRHGAITYHGHFGVMAADQTVQGYINAAKVGFESVVMVPKMTSDGVFVAFHDDDKIGTKFRMPDGTALTTADQAKKISDFTYEQLLAFDLGLGVSAAYAGQKIATIDEIFEVCSKTGMKPMFSVHGLPQFDDASTSVETWGRIREMLIKHGLLGKMQVKAGSVAELTKAHAVLGDDIDSYIVDWNTSGDAVAAWRGVSWFDPLLCKIEFFAAYATEANIKAAVAAGVTVSSAESAATVARRKQLIEWGVTEWTEDAFFGFGLNC